MALTKDKKQAVIAELTDLFSNTKMTVFAHYDGVTVKELQELRKTAKESGTTVRVAKNRLVQVAMKNVDTYKDVDVSSFTGQILFAFNAEDEVAPAQNLAHFAKKHPNLRLIGGIDAEASLMDEAQIKQLADLPSKDQLRGQVVGTIAAPLSGFVRVLNGNLSGLMNVLSAHKQNLETS